MSRILSYQKTVETISSMDGATILTNPLSLNRNKPLYIRLIKFSISSYIPNVYNYNGTNNGLLRTSKDGGATWDIIQLPMGVYSIPLIQAAIQDVISTYWADPSDQGFFLRYNSATFQTYIEIDSTKLAVAGQFCIDFGYSTSLIYELLGFTGTKLFNTDGLNTAPSYAKLDWFGNNISVLLNGVGSISIKNGVSTNEFCVVPLSSSENENEYVYPMSGIVSPWIIINSLDSLSQFSVKFVGESNQPIYVFQGSVNLIFEISQIPY